MISGKGAQMIYKEKVTVDLLNLPIFWLAKGELMCHPTVFLTSVTSMYTSSTMNSKTQHFRT